MTQLTNYNDNYDNATNEAAQLTNRLGLTKDGRRRWKRPKKLTKNELLLANLDLNMELAAMFKLKGFTWEAVAAQLEVPVESVINWPKLTKFQEIYAKTVQIYRREQKAFLLSLVPDALKTMEWLMNNDRSGHVRYEAAQAILTHAEVAQDDDNTESVADHRALLDSLRKKAEGVTNQLAVQVNVNTYSPAPAPEVVEAEVKRLD